MNVDVSRLNNGVHVLSQDMPYLETCGLGVWVQAGARDEALAQNGIAHLLEHMAFKGTRRRSARDIAAEIESAGGDINAGTSMESTAYFARVLKDDWPMALDILADILLNPRFDQNDLAQEKQVILQEIAAANDTPDDVVFELSQQIAFGNHPLGRSILGKPEQVAQFQAQDIIDYRDHHYSAARLVIAAAGRIDHAALCAQVEDLFGNVAPACECDRHSAVFQSGVMRRERPIDQAHLVFGFPSCGYLDPEIYAVQLLAAVLGGGMSSRLFQQIREEKGLCYTVFAHPVAYADCGMMQIYAATAPEAVNDLTAAIGDVILSLEGTIDEAEIARAKAQLKTGLVMSLESPSARADQIARQFMAFGKVPEVSSIIERIEAVDADDIHRLVKRVFRTQAPVVSAVGAIGGLEQHDKLAARLV